MRCKENSVDSLLASSGVSSFSEENGFPFPGSTVTIDGGLFRKNVRQATAHLSFQTGTNEQKGHDRVTTMA